MEYTIEPYDRSHLGTLRELVSHHSLRDEFRWLAAPGGLEDHFTDPYTSPDLRRIARADGAPVGFGFALIPPAGIEVRTYDGSERALGEWNEAYNAAFAEHWHFVPAEVEHARAITRLAHFRPAGLVLAYRDRRCVGFCRNALRGREGEVALL